MIKRFKLYLTIVVLLLLLLSGCKQANDQDRGNLTIGLMPDIGMLPLLVAKEEGYFNDQHLNVNFIIFKSAKERDSALQSGQLDGAMSDLLAVYFLNSNGWNVKATSVTDSRFMLLAAKDARITKVTDLHDIEVGLSLNTVIEYIVDMILLKNGVEARKLSVPQVPVRMELLRNGQLAAASLPDPLATVLKKSGAVVLSDNFELNIHPAVLIFTEKTIEEKRDYLNDFYSAYDRAVKAINQNPEKYRALLVAKGQFPEAIISDIDIPVFKSAKNPPKDEVEKILTWVKNKNLAKKELVFSDLVFDINR